MHTITNEIKCGKCEKISEKIVFCIHIPPLPSIHTQIKQIRKKYEHWQLNDKHGFRSPYIIRQVIDMFLVHKDIGYRSGISDTVRHLNEQR